MASNSVKQTNMVQDTVHIDLHLPAENLTQLTSDFNLLR